MIFRRRRARSRNAETRSFEGVETDGLAEDDAGPKWPTLDLFQDLSTRDIEALAWHGDTLFVVGSHSRNKDCVRKPKRQRLRVLAEPCVVEPDTPQRARQCGLVLQRFVLLFVTSNDL